jgi:cytochrome P450
MALSKITNTPNVPTWQVAMDTAALLNSPVQVFEKYRKQYGNVFSFRFGVKRTIVVADPELLKHVLKDNNDNYHKSHIQTERFVEFQGVGLTNSHGDYWHRQRRLLSMGFTRSRLTEILPIQLKVLEDFMSGFEADVAKGPVDIHRQMVMFTLLSVGKSLFGSQMKKNELEQFANAISEVQAYLVKKVVQPYLFPWFALTGQDKKYHKIRTEGEQIVIDYIEERRKSQDKGFDILQLILDTPYKDTGELMDDETVKVEILQLLVAGNETSTTAATWTFYQLSKYPEHVRKIRAEIDAVFGDGEVTYAKLHDLKYLINVLDESMRNYPPFWMIDRVALADDEFNGVKIPAGTTVVPYIYGVHHNETVWPNPDVFDPMRFEQKQHPFAFIPFGGGPRVCIGQNMALMQILLVLATIIRKYDFNVVNGQEIGIKSMMLLRPDGPIPMEFKSV